MRKRTILAAAAVAAAAIAVARRRRAIRLAQEWWDWPETASPSPGAPRRPE